MTERPILFSAPMVRAILDGRKTMTRRVAKLKPWHRIEEKEDGSHWPWMEIDGADMGHWLPCPYGAPGDRLWVRENGWERPPRDAKMLRQGADTWVRYYYDTDLSDQDHQDFKAWGFKRRPSIHMPRRASRITLEITEVRVERLNDISEHDAMAEGVEGTSFLEEAERMEPATGVMPGRYAFRALWESIHGADSWTANPWVWVVGFRRVT